MKLTEMFLAELEREAVGTRRVLAHVPDGRFDWKPHEKSMSLGQLSNLVANMPSWVVSIVSQDELDFDPPGGSVFEPPKLETSRELVEAHERHVASAREALASTTDEHLMTTWKLLARGQVMREDPRHIAIRDGVFNHLSHHRGQLTVYLRLIDAPVPAVYGPSADERLG
jgi:uncharacterized damage-inducible protein DinB